MRRLVWGVIAALAAAGVGATELVVRRFNKEHGLSGHPIAAITHDAAGRLWVGSYGGGLASFDGLGWTQLSSRNGLTSNRVVALIPGSGGELWVSCAAGEGGSGGLAIVHDGEVVSAYPSDGWEVASGLETTSGLLWLAFRGGGLGTFDGSVLQPLAEHRDLAFSRMVEGSDGLLWLLGRPAAGGPDAAGVIVRWGEDGFVRLGPTNGLPDAPFNDLHLGRDGTLWIATGAGLFRQVRGSRFGPASFATGASVARPIRAVAEDAAGDLWLGADGAVLRVRGDAVSELKLPLAIGPVPVVAVRASPVGGVFARTAGHVLRLEGRTAELLALPDRSSLLPGGSVSDPLAWEAAFDAVVEANDGFAIDGEGSVWAIAGREVVRYTGDEARRFGRDEGLPSDDIRALLVDAGGRLWVGTAQGAAVFNVGDGYFQRIGGTQAAIDQLFEDRSGTIYAAAGGRVLRIGSDFVAEAWAPAETLTTVAAFAVDARGTLFIGTAEGLVRSTIDGMLLSRREDGLAADAVVALGSDGADVLIGHDDGLTVLTGSAFAPRPAFAGQRVLGFLGGGAAPLVLTAAGLRRLADGRLERPLAGDSRLYSAHRGADGSIWLGLDLGVVKGRGYVESLLTGGAYPTEPVVAIASHPAAFGGESVWLGTATGLYRHSDRTSGVATRVEVVGVATQAGGKIELPADVTQLAVKLSAFSFLGPRGSADVRFETRLLPRETYWSHAGAGHRHLLDLRPGRYALQARSVSRELTVGSPSRIDIAIGQTDEPAPVAPDGVDALPRAQPGRAAPKPAALKPAAARPAPPKPPAAAGRPASRLVLPPVARP